MLNSIYLRRKNKVIVTKGNGSLSNEYLATSIKNLESYGYTFSEDLINVLRTLSNDEFVDFYTKLIEDIKVLKGAHVTHSPMYPNFPKEVMELDECELYINAIREYTYSWLVDNFNVTLENKGLPLLEKKERFPLIGNFDIALIDLGTKEEFDKTISNLISSKTSISETDKNDVLFVLNNYDDLSSVLPSEVPMKENLAFLVGNLLTLGKLNEEDVSKYFKTATDILRFAVVLSNGDVSLAGHTRFRSFKKSERRLILSLIEKTHSPKEDMKAYKEEWKRLAEKIHPGNFKNRYKKAFNAFQALRNDEKIVTFSTKVEEHIKNKDILEVCALLSKRPGEFARRLDHLIRLNVHPEVVVMYFSKVAKDVPTPLLLQLRSHFLNRNNENDLRVFFPKGNVANLFATENKLEKINESISSELALLIENVLIERFAELPSLGKTVIDKSLSSYLVPFSQRSASKSLKTISRGSTFDLPEGDFVRFFTYWKEHKPKDGNSWATRVDVDLSALFLNEDWVELEQVSYTNLRSDHSVHSGDITSAPNGASEFIDIDINKAVGKGIRYVVMNLYNFTEHKFCDLPEAFSGWMIRNNMMSGEIFEPSTVVEKFDLSANSSIAIPVIIDLVERKVTWCDLSLNRDIRYVNNVHANGSMVSLMGKSMVNLVKPNLYDLFELHAKARGEIVTLESLVEDEKPDTVFSVSEGIKPTDIDVIMAEFL